jgi:hypothetical protein
MQANRWLPVMANTIADPYIALRHHLDVQKLFCASAALVAADDESRKKLSLKRASLKLVRSVSSSSKVRPGDDDKQYAKLESNAAERIGAEVERIIKALSNACDTFAELLFTAAGVRSIDQRNDLSVLIPYVMLDVTITRHARLKSLMLADNRLYIAIGRAQLQAHVYTVTAAHGYSLVNAEERLKRIVDHGDVWLTKVFGDRAKSAMPVAWRLDPETHEEMLETELEIHTRHMMREVPLLMIAVLSVSGLSWERETLLRALMQYSY